MKDPIRVLVIEDRKSDRFIAQQLLGNYDLDFTWQHVASESELRTIAQGFDPSLVFSANELTLNSRSAALDMLRLLSLQPVMIHVAEVDDLDGSTFNDVAALEWKPVQLPALAAAAQTAAPGIADEAERPPSHWCKSLPSLLDTSKDLVALSDSAGWITYANTNASRLFSEPSQQLVGTVLGLAYDFAAPAPGPHRLALFDSSTGLPNPVHLSDLVGCMMSRPQSVHTALPIVVLDLQGLRFLNELSGPAMSDEVLDVVGSELKSGATGCGMIARVGEDDLLLVLPLPSHPSDAAVNVQGKRRLSGVFEDSIAPDERSTEAHATETKAPAIADPSLTLPSINTGPPPKHLLPVEAGLDDALKRQAISVHYQPQFALQSGLGCGLEALARWNLASGKHVAPSVFIPVAERSGMIDILGASVLRSACETAAAWRGRDAERLTVSVNVSTLQINAKFLKVLAQILDTTGLQPPRLELEIEEAAVLANTDLTVQCLKQWRQLGVRVAVNHAGNNYSSLSYLSRLPIDRLKLDKSLIQNMTLDNEATGAIHALISLGAALGVDVIAEGVETEPQFHMLLELGCLQAQGYLLARPMPAVQAQIALRKPWGNMPREVRRPLPAVQEKYAS